MSVTDQIIFSCKLCVSGHSIKYGIAGSLEQSLSAFKSADCTIQSPYKIAYGGNISRKEDHNSEYLK